MVSRQVGGEEGNSGDLERVAEKKRRSQGG